MKLRLELTKPATPGPLAHGMEQSHAWVRFYCNILTTDSHWHPLAPKKIGALSTHNSVIMASDGIE